jgi:hypothetical protein
MTDATDKELLRRAAKAECQCSLRIRLTGDGCRYCQPQDYIDRLHDNAKDDHDEIERLEARIAELEAALRCHYEADKRLYEMPFDCEPADDIAALEEHDASFKAIGDLLGVRAAAALGENIKPELDDADK